MRMTFTDDYGSVFASVLRRCDGLGEIGPLVETPARVAGTGGNSVVVARRRVVTREVGVTGRVSELVRVREEMLWDRESCCQNAVCRCLL